MYQYYSAIRFFFLSIFLQLSLSHIINHQEIKMAPPPWLPPLNSHDRYTVSVVASQKQEPWCSPMSEEPIFLIKAAILVAYFSDDYNNNMTFEGMSYKNWFTINCSHITSDPSSSEVIRELLDNLQLPFELNNLCWGARHLEGFIEGPRQLENSDVLVHKIWEFACDMKEQLMYGNNVLPLDLDIAKRIIVPDFELNQWNTWYDEKMKADENFENDFTDAISRPRREDELLYETTLAFKAATKSSIQRLEKLRVDNRSIAERSCAICFEEFPLGSQIIRLGCSHTFHEDCIVRWLQESHLCPLCRFALPSE